MSHQLTIEDLRVLRSADTVSFHLLDGKPGRHLLVATTDVRLGELRSRPRMELAVDGSVWDYAHRGGTSGYRAFAMVHGGAHSSWDGIARLLRPRDEITLEWVAANDSENLRRVAHHRDELWLDIHRRGRPIRLLVAVSVGPDNTARMVRYDPHQFEAAGPVWVDRDAVATEVATALAGSHATSGVLLVGPDVAAGLPPVVYVGPAALRVQADQERADDEVVVTDPRSRKVLGQGLLVPVAVQAAGPAAAAAYRQLRGGGMRPHDAEQAARAIGLPAD